MSKNLAEDYFSLTRSNRDGGLSPYSSSMITPNASAGLHPTLSWGDTPEFAGLTKTKSATGNIYYKSVGVSKAQSDTKVYPYHTIHLTVPVPPNLKPKTPEDVLSSITGKCIQCSSIVSKNECIHLNDNNINAVNNADDNNANNDDNIEKFSRLRMTSPSRHQETLVKSILTRKGNKSSQIDSHFSNSVSFDTVNLRFSDDLLSYPLSSFSDSDDDNEHDSYNYYNTASNNSIDSTDSDATFERRGRNSTSSTCSTSPSRRTSSRSPSRSLSPGARTSPISQSFDMVSEKENNIKKFFSLKYPTSPIITHDACTLTRKHKLFDDMYANRLKYTQPKLHNRVIMCYISGRKHTWVGIDWACNQFLEDGDSLIIVSSIKNPGRSLSRYQRRNSDVAILPNITENKIRNSPEYAQAVTENIMKYALSIVNPERIVKFTVELAIGSTNDVFTDMFDLYQPSLIITGVKPGKAAPTKAWATKRLSDKIVVRSPVPTIIVSPINMGLYETKLFKVLDKRMIFMDKSNLNTYHENDNLLDELDKVGVYSLKDQREYIRETASNDAFILKELECAIKEMKHEPTNDTFICEDKDNDNNSVTSNDQNLVSSSASSFDSTSVIDSNDEDEKDDISVDSANPPAFHANPKNSASFKLKRLELETQVVIYKEVSKLESEPLTENSFKHLLTVVSDAAHKYGVQLAESAKMGSEESALVRTLTGAPEQIERRKSMVTDAIEEDDFNEKLKRFRQQKKLEQQQKLNGKNNKASSKLPRINIDTNNSSNSVINTGLKITKSPLSASSSISSSTTNSILTPNVKEGKKKGRGFFGLFKK
jgi:hypothetical protein